MEYALIAPFDQACGASIKRIYESLAQRLASDGSVYVSMVPYDDGHGHYVKAVRGGWSLRVHIEEGPHVLEESREIANSYGSRRANADAIGSCGCRITVDSDDDLNMDNFNDYVACLEVVAQFKPEAMFEPLSERFVD